MCGIAGCFLLPDSGSLLSWLHFSRSVLAHRGPDDFGVFSDQSVGIGLTHTRLAIQDVSPLGHQPMQSSDGRWLLVFNGEIYNFQILRHQLLADGYTFRGESDTEVLLALWEQRGVECLNDLNGMFAFAIWDSQECELFVIRDSSGIKPLFYTQLPHGFYFASEAKALPPLLPSVSQDLADSLLRQLSYLWCPGPGTINPSIHSLEPGCLVHCRHGQPLISKRWCDPLPSLIPQFRHTKEATQATLSCLRKAVHRQMVADVPLGAFLSGGLDSSAVVALARELDPNLQCFTIVNSGGTESGFAEDLPYARRVARYLDVTLNEIEIQPSDLATDLRWLLAQLDAPVADPAPLNVFHISRAARSLGIKVLLSGAGGDDLFTGYRRHLALQAETFWGWWPRPLRRGLRIGSQCFGQQFPLVRRLFRTFQLADADPQERLIQYFRWGTPPRLRQLLSTQLQLQLRDPTASAPFQDWLANLPPGLSRLQQMLALEQRFFLADHNLHYTDAMSMAAGVEVRVPFLDPDLVALSWRLPDGLKQRGRCGKWVLKRAMSGLLPHDVIYRPKSGFGAPLRRWLQHDLHELVVDTLSSSRLATDGLFSPNAVAQLLDDHFSGRTDDAYTIWSLLCISLWWERHNTGVV